MPVSARPLPGLLARGPVLSPARITLEKENSGRSRIGRTLYQGQVAEGMGLTSNLLHFVNI